MNYEQSLKKAIELKGTAKSFQMQDAICLAHSMRWMIDQILGREFSETPESARVPRDYSTIIKIQETEKRREKAKKLYNRLTALPVPEKMSPTQHAARSHLSDKFAQKIEVEQEMEGATVMAGLDAIPRLLTGEHDCAYLISLRTDAKQNQGGNIKTYNHTLAAYSRAGNVSFFDPNMGEVRVQRERFAEWLKVYHSEWTKYPNMQYVNSIYCFQIRAPGDVSKYVKALKSDTVKDIFEDLSHKNEDLLGNSDISLSLTSGVKDVLQTMTPFDDPSLDVVFK